MPKNDERPCIHCGAVQAEHAGNMSVYCVEGTVFYEPAPEAKDIRYRLQDLFDRLTAEAGAATDEDVVAELRLSVAHILNALTLVSFK